MESTRATVVGVFDHRDKADRAVEELRRIGFSDDQIGYAMRGEEHGTIAETGSHNAGEGLATGAVIGGLVGAAAALLIPGVGPVVAGGVLASVLGGAAVGAAAGGILGALVGMGIPEDEASYYQDEFEAGRTLVTVRAGSRFDEARDVLRRFGAYDINSRDAQPSTGDAPMIGRLDAAASGSSYEARGPGGRGDSMELRDEPSLPRSRSFEAGEVEIGKRVVSEQQSVAVPMTRDEVVIDRQPVNRPASGPIGSEETIRVPLREEQVSVDKQTVAREQVSVHTRPTTETPHVTDTARHERPMIDRSGAMPMSAAGSMDASRWQTWDDAMPHFRDQWQQRYGGQGGRWDEHESAYRFGWEMWNRPEYRDRQWDEVEPSFRRDWETHHVGSPWDRAMHSIRHAWESVSGGSHAHQHRL